MTDLTRAQWRKAARSGTANGGCVDVAGNLPRVTAIRDSKRPEDGAHVVDRRRSRVPGRCQGWPLRRLTFRREGLAERAACLTLWPLAFLSTCADSGCWKRYKRPRRRARVPCADDCMH